MNKQDKVIKAQQRWAAHQKIWLTARPILCPSCDNNVGLCDYYDPPMCEECTVEQIIKDEPDIGKPL